MNGTSCNFKDVISKWTRQKQKRLERWKRLLRRLSVTACKCVCFTDEKVFYVNPPVNNQNNRVWSAGKKSCVPQCRLLIERAKFAPHVMVSAGISFEGKGGLHFVEKKAKVNADYSKPVAVKISGRLSPIIALRKVYFSTRWSASACGKSDSVLACCSLFRLYWQRLLATK